MSKIGAGNMSLFYCSGNLKPRNLHVNTFGPNFCFNRIQALRGQIQAQLPGIGSLVGSLVGTKH